MNDSYMYVLFVFMYMYVFCVCALCMKGWRLFCVRRFIKFALVLFIKLTIQPEPNELVFRCSTFVIDYRQCK